MKKIAIVTRCMVVGGIAEYDVENIYQHIVKLIVDKELRDRLSKNLGDEIVDTREEINKLDIILR